MNTTSSKETNVNGENPFLDGLKDFFNYHSLEESRRTLWKWLNVSSSREFDKLSMKEREELLVFYAHLQDLLETVHKIKVTPDKEDVLQKE